MPSAVYLTFDAPDHVPLNADRLHAAWGRVLDLPEGITSVRAQQVGALRDRPHHDHPSGKPYSIATIAQSAGRIGMELRLLNDGLLNVLETWMASGGVLQIIDRTTGPATLLAIDAQILRSHTWEEVLGDDSATAWTIHLTTPIIFRAHGRVDPRVTPSALATSLHSRWRAWSPSTCPYLPARDELQAALTAEDHTTQRSVHLGGKHPPITASTGSIDVSGAPGARATEVFSVLMALTPYTNAGWLASWGMGVLDVEPHGRAPVG